MRRWLIVPAIVLLVGVGLFSTAGAKSCRHHSCPPPTTTTTTVPPSTTTSSTTTTTTSPPQPGAILSGEQAGFSESYQPTSESATDLARRFDAIAATGAKWVRFDFYWSAIQPTSSSFDWSGPDRAVAAANARGLHVLGDFAYTPAWARPGTNDDKYPPADMQTYANFARAAAARYAPLGVHAWEIWNEPNVQQFWLPFPDPAQYGAMLRAAYPAIHAADPNAVVITGGSATAGPTLDSTAGNGFSPYRWLRLLYEGGNRPYFDAVGNHPYATFPYSPLETWNSTHWQANMHDLMVTNGDGAKKVWGTEAGYTTAVVDEATQAQYIEDYLTVWRGWAAWTGPLFIYQMKDRGTCGSCFEDAFGLLHNDWSHKPSYDRFNADVG